MILGFGLMIAVVGLGLDILFQRFPQILPVMRVAGSIYMIWLALKIALAKPVGEVEAGGRPIGFLAAAGFQWVNPKAWVMALSALAAYAGVVDGYTTQRPFHRGAVRLDSDPLRRRLAGVRRLAQPPAQGSAGDPTFQLDDGGVAGRLDRAHPVRIGLGERTAAAELDHHHFGRAQDTHRRERCSQSARNDHPPLAQRVFAIDVFS